MDFRQFYRLLHGREPFIWQTEMAEALSSNKWEDALIVPCGGGKTSILEIWLHSLYRNIVSGVGRFMPLRLYYVVDRRVIVDSSYRLAMKIRDALNQPEFAVVAKVLQDYFKVPTPLVVGRMRGGLDRNEKNAWITSPNQPSIIMSTIDQYGSRLLFRGYGISPKLRSLHAGLAAVDSLLVLDESHLAQALRGTVSDILRISKPGSLGNVPQTKVLELSATSVTKSHYSFNLAGDEMLQRRLSVNRPARLVDADRLVPTLTSLAANAPDEVPGAKLIGVVCNSVNVARSVFENLKKKGKALLLIGRIRHWERQNLSKKHFADLLVDTRKRGEEAEIIYVVTTQTVEVGADIDFDVLVTEACPLDNLIQRFGRLDRVGRFGQSQGFIVFNKAQEKDFIYGDRTSKTWEYLIEKYPDKEIKNFGAVPVDTSLYATTARISKLSSMSVFRLAHTFPDVPVDIDTYLHGVQPANSEFNLVYRSEISNRMLEDDRKRQQKRQATFAYQWLRLAKPRITEMVSLPIRTIFQQDASDTAYTTGTDTKKGGFSKQLCVRYSDWAVIEIGKVQPGDTVFVPPEFGQHDEFGWCKSSDVVEDVYDLVSERVLRVHSDWFPGFRLAGYVGDDGDLDLRRLLRELRRKLPDNPRGHAAKVKLQRLRRETYEVIRHTVTPDGKGVYVYLRERRVNGVGRQGLSEHNNRVGVLAERYAEAVGLKPEIVKILGLAGKSHDLGKGDPRFQDELYSPDPRVPGLLIAKSVSGNGHRFHHLPAGWRHELQSVVIMEENDIGTDTVDPDLVRHLVASHHGHSRNTFPLVEDKGFEPFEVYDHMSLTPYFNLLTQQNRDQFHLLNERYGYWGLAYLESILRLADAKGSSHD